MGRFSHPSSRRNFSSKFTGSRKVETSTEEKPKPKAILISRNSGGIGDMLMITPSIRQIKKDNPDKSIIVCTTERYGRGSLIEVLAHNPDIDKVITVSDLQNYEFEKVYNFGTGKEVEIETTYPTHRIDIFAELGGLTLDDKKPIYHVTPQEKAWATKWITKNVSPKRRRLIGIQVEASTARRTWPLEKQWLLTFRILNKYPDSTILFFNEGNPPETEIYPNIIPLGDMCLRDVGALLNECEVLVCPDSGLLHLAGALDVKTVTLFGPNPPRSRLLYYPKAVGVWLGYPCSQNCWYQRCYHEFKCMTEITVESVLEKVEELIRGEIKPDSLHKKLGTLFIRMGGVGDLITLSSSLRKYRETHPDEILTFATKPENLQVLKGAEFIDEIIPIPDFYRAVYQKVIDLRYKVESPEVGGTLDRKIYCEVPRSDIFDKLIGVSDVKSDRKFYTHVNADKVEEMKKRLFYGSKRNLNKKWVLVQATCTSNTRTFPPEILYELLCNLAAEPNLRVVVFGRDEFWHGRNIGKDLLNKIGKDEQTRRIINMMGDLSFDDLTALCLLSDFIICPDSAAVHIGGALGKKTLAVFGNMDPYLRVYYYSSVKAIVPEKVLPCIYCYDFQNPCLVYKSKHTQDQPIGGECMRKIPAQKIFDEAKEWFGF